VSPQAEIGSNVSIGPFCVVDSDVKIGDGTTLAARVSVKDGTRLGKNNEISEGAILGGRPQHKRAGEKLGELHIGNGNTIRENVTLHRGLEPGNNTVVGDNNLIMVNAHVAHDCHIGNQTIIANNVMLAGHVTVGNCAYLSGAAGIHQFCRIGHYAMVGGQAHINQDVPPFVTIDGQSSTVVGLNIIGLRRAGFSDADLLQLKQAYRIVYRSGMTWSETLRVLADTFHDGPAAQFLPFLSSGKRGFTQERRVPRSATVPLPRRTEVCDDSDAPTIKLRNAG
jgi:UDP-N-acetylglucosamine acyltransferase